VRAAVKDMAEQLTKLYAERMKAPGYAFSPDSDMQNDFERRFEFEETDDQLRCIDEIKGDMEKNYPMDRLLCGDVGFGKTEVALRAAFKCIAEGKQCAMLVPTTILAFQHYQTILKRFEGFPVEVDMISRFRTPQEQAKILRGLRQGSMDMVVGTHRLISKDIKFKDLGLVIIDEEQRFGVAQKEHLKELFPTVDVLTLSATPIPRTLNMAMTGIRDMSMLEEAPQDRHPVQTYVMEHDMGILAEAIQKELRRGGQVYYLHNRVDTITRAAARIREFLPEARIGIAHGKMEEEELSEIWSNLLNGEIDVLVCTTIIETGVDVPNVNTLIIENADRLGLAQLHQIRGRVGRSTRRAYAYLTFTRGKELSEIATRRLSAIREYTEFGSGFQIAMRDLEIRGAGNILGAQQHGHMEAVGYDMYIQMLSEAIAEERGEKPQKPEEECLIDLQVEAHIPEEYIESIPQRLSIYRRIADIRTPDDVEDVYDELIDRFGDPPPSVQGLVNVSLLRNSASGQGIYEISQRGNCLLLYSNAIDMQKVSRLAALLRGRILVSAGAKPYISVKMGAGQSPVDTLQEALRIYSLEPEGKK
jgi:transcription-repair coupling factor (superfamily II helicase)